jgi:Zn-dependent protease/predicted transcriptional regulator
MRWSFQIARIAGIDVKIHATFFLLLAYFAYAGQKVGGTPAAISSVLFVCLVFVCVLLHEFGHALAARRYGIRTPDITLLPIGGVARLEKMPDNPAQEVVVAIAGPLVNVAIAAVLALIIYLTGGFPAQVPLDEHSLSLPLKLLGVNVMLVVFNLIPAFPMDGGRVLRALLAMRMEYARATNIAATTGQVIAVVFFLVGLTGYPMFLLIGVFVFFGAQNEAAFAQLKSASSGMRVSSAMITQFKALPLNSTLNEAVEALLHTSQHDFPVTDELGQIRGVLTRSDLIVALRKSGAGTPVAEVMRVDVPAVHYAMHFDRAFLLMQECGSPVLPVIDGAGRLVGLFTTDNVGEMMMVQGALARSAAGNSPGRVKPPPLPAS